MKTTETHNIDASLKVASTVEKASERKRKSELYKDQREAEKAQDFIQKLPSTFEKRREMYKKMSPSEIAAFRKECFRQAGGDKIKEFPIDGRRPLTVYEWEDFYFGPRSE